MRHTLLTSLTLSAALAAGIAPGVARAASTDTVGTSYVIRSLTGSKTATSVTLPEVEKAAMAKFSELDAENDGTLDRTEMAGLMSYSDFTLANTHHDATSSGTLSRAEYMAYVVKLFEFTNIQPTGAEGSLSATELSSDSGVKLTALLKI